MQASCCYLEKVGKILWRCIYDDGRGGFTESKTILDDVEGEEEFKNLYAPFLVFTFFYMQWLK